MGMKFRCGDHIGSGGFGTVDKASRLDDYGTEVETGLARKMLLDKWLNDDLAVARFKKEVRLLDELEHVNILSVEGRNLTDIPPWFIMPFAESNLSEEVAIHAGERGWVIDRFSAILAGMEYAHNRQVVHRDLKPENVLLVKGVVKIADFGLGKHLDADSTHLTQSHIGMGSLNYMPPEQLVDFARAGAPADIYALGKILGEMLTGDRPQMGRPRLEDYPDEYQGFIERCTEDDPADRYANGEDARAAFELLVSGGGATGDVSGVDFENLLKDWENANPFSSEDELRGVAQALAVRRDDEEFFFRVVPRLPLALVRELIRFHPSEFDAILRAYNEHIQGGLPFDYCDVVANFYRSLFHFDTTINQKRLILTRLIELGPGHNRWYVGEVFGSLLSELSDPAEIRMAVKVIRENPKEANWNESYVEPTAPRAIRDAFKEVQPHEPEGVISF